MTEPTKPPQPAPQPAAQQPSQPAPTPAPQPQPAAAPAPQAVGYVPDDAVVRAVVDGKPLDVRVSDLKRQYQMQSAAEKRLAEANQLRTQYRSDLDTMERIRNLARINPAAAQEELHKTFGLRPTQTGADNQGNYSQANLNGEEAPETTALRSEIAQLRAEMAGINQFRDQMLVQSVTQQVKEAVRTLPLYQRDEQAARRAELFVAQYLSQNPTATANEVAGAVHAEDVEFVQRQLQAQRDQRVTNTSNLASVPPSVGTPGVNPPQIPKPSIEEIRSGAWKKRLDSYVGEVRKQFGLS